MDESKNITNINIFGGNNQVLPNATHASQTIIGGTSADSQPTLDIPMATYIGDQEALRGYIIRIGQAPDVVTLCKSVVADIFNDVLADTVNPADTVKSEAFINALIPLCTFDSGKTVKNIRAAIRKYVLCEVEP